MRVKGTEAQSGWTPSVLGSLTLPDLNLKPSTDVYRDLTSSVQRARIQEGERGDWGVDSSPAGEAHEGVPPSDSSFRMTLQPKVFSPTVSTGETFSQQGTPERPMSAHQQGTEWRTEPAARLHHASNAELTLESCCLYCTFVW